MFASRKVAGGLPVSRTGLCGALAIAILLGALAVGSPFAPRERVLSKSAGAVPPTPGPKSRTGAGVTATPVSTGSIGGELGAGETGARDTAGGPAGAPAGYVVAPLRISPAAADSRADHLEALPDPDRVGECPREPLESKVVRRGIDPADRWPTWWHVDGSLTKRVQQRLRDPKTGEVIGEEPRVVVLRPAGERRVPAEAKTPARTERSQ